jgi:ketosteroid isomerase-like protein
VRRAHFLSRLSLTGIVLLLMTLAACSAGSAPTSSAQAELQHKADLYDIDQIEVMWHQAASTHNVDLMMSLWADGATFTLGGMTYTGKDQIRTLFATKAAPFQPINHWESDTPAYKIKITVNGDTGTLYFECHYVDPATKKVMVVAGANQDVQRINGTWLIVNSIGTSPALGS